MRPYALAVAALIALATAAAAPAASAPVAVKDPEGDAGKGKLDIARVSLGPAADGRLRAAVTMARPWSPRDLLGHSGPPGTVCVRMWLSGRRPSSSAPDYLACATVATDNDKLKGTVMHERAGDLPERAGSASATMVSSRTAVLRFAQSAIGRPATLRFGFEALPAGCPALSCTDTAPDAPRSARLVLRSSS